MIKKLGIYNIGQKVNENDELKIFSKKDYHISKTFGMNLMFKDEDFYHGQPVFFASTFWDSTTIGAINGRIYKIAIQILGTKKNYSNKIMAEAINIINDYTGQFDISKISFYKEKYVWDKKEGNVFLVNRKFFNKCYINLIVTSNDLQ